jgi:hypothetical protein
LNKRLSHLGTDVLDQWERVNRWHSKLAQIPAALPDREPAKSFALDVVWAFFENCFHLRHWVIKEATDEKKRRLEVDAFIDGSAAMQLCRDVANGVKHYRLDPAKRTTHDANWSTATRSEPVVITGQGSRLVGGHGPRWVFTGIGHNEPNMFDVADECLAAWRSFLKV